ncbi:type IV pilus assembly protein PilV [Noviherbaspirillum humi]|uniref:Type IV pilus assembly protein PilV n=1 Tax=Noviherbaspirillum humi TaxID=1688639 RepID=A0A239DLP3_9BURK|nr:prepilin-type N-terminal cleavage/methylation domain-containing protein [Noviherbaspirillum humi]SNS32981.1 type IV pilus assembly protein PilV [Noviherbaspirillum humi]
MLNTACQTGRQRGASMIEVLVTVVILAFGLLGLGALQSKIQVAEFEAHERTQAVVLLAEISERLSANRALASSYLNAGTIGTGDNQPASCATLATGPARDLCEWSNALKGAAEQSKGARQGAMIGARACITQVQAPDATTGVCAPGIYRVTVSWQGMSRISAPSLTCGQGSYGSDDAYRRAIATDVSIGLPSCL